MRACAVGNGYRRLDTDRTKRVQVQLAFHHDNPRRRVSGGRGSRAARPQTVSARERDAELDVPATARRPGNVSLRVFGEGDQTVGVREIANILERGHQIRAAAAAALDPSRRHVVSGKRSTSAISTSTDAVDGFDLVGTNRATKASA